MIRKSYTANFKIQVIEFAKSISGLYKGAAYSPNSMVIRFIKIITKKIGRIYRKIINVNIRKTLKFSNLVQFVRYFEILRIRFKKASLFNAVVLNFLWVAVY